MLRRGWVGAGQQRVERSAQIAAVGRGTAGTGVVDEAARRCAAGEDVELERYPLADHNPALDYSAVGVVGWLEDRFAGRPSASNCG